MGAYIKQSIDDTIEAFIYLAKKIILKDDIIDNMESIIESECLNLITCQQPIASDLQMITSVLKIVTDLERIADHCADISELTIKLSESKYKYYIGEIPKMALQTKKMIKQTIDTYVELDIEKAIKIAKEKDIVDKYFYDILNKLQSSMRDNIDFIKEGTYFMLIAKYFERMDEHTTNICE